jgi:hypothetical protein
LNEDVVTGDRYQLANVVATVPVFESVFRGSAHSAVTSAAGAIEPSASRKSRHGVDPVGCVGIRHNLGLGS